MKHRLRGVGLALVLALVMAACADDNQGGGSTGGTQAAATKPNVAFLPKAVNNPYFDTAAKGGKQAATELQGEFKQVGPPRRTRPRRSRSSAR